MMMKVKNYNGDIKKGIYLYIKDFFNLKFLLINILLVVIFCNMVVKVLINLKSFAQVQMKLSVQEIM